jgi:hypothetical protein
MKLLIRMAVESDLGIWKTIVSHNYRSVKIDSAILAFLIIFVKFVFDFLGCFLCFLFEPFGDIGYDSIFFRSFWHHIYLSYVTFCRLHLGSSCILCSVEACLRHHLLDGRLPIGELRHGTDTEKYRFLMGDTCSIYVCEFEWMCPKPFMERYFCSCYDICRMLS